ncbi:ABC transporter ATP-binding protein [Actinosynnema sp. NPDC047251]|uniref:ABC transporter-like protein n=1 Tax=Saccharothrix espanaensis (strain ATCC 51144 / DSM 44229 / JCM 9112 / NBRC 15066 / NRRL 15764) TaxID=1179773 RepID=K0K737_SACES|nr:ABC transporter ATP-binding protein [Saccharothrix espanaensis]CCH32413.1 ABC transporter-like protein [Saccharothrix espanaensis DSM 44229]
MTTATPAVSPPAALQAVAVSAGYRRRRRHPAVTVLRDVHLAARPGELITLIGPNGAGKSTLLRTLVGAQPPLAGHVLLDGRDLGGLSPRDRARRLAVVLTEPVDVGQMSVASVVALGRLPYRSWIGRDTGHDRAAVDRALVDAGVDWLRDRPLHDLSDGERQRVMVARALAQEPAVLVLDEPTAFLDVARRIELAAMLTRLTATTGAAIVLSTHDLGFALRRSDQVWLVGGDGAVTAGAPEDLAHSDAIARTFAGENMTFDDAAATIVVADETVPGATVRVVGEGRTRQWAEHAVRRAGWTPTEAGGGRVLRVEPGTPCRWRVDGPDAHGVGFDTLVSHLRGQAVPLPEDARTG